MCRNDRSIPDANPVPASVSTLRFMYLFQTLSTHPSPATVVADASVYVRMGGLSKHGGVRSINIMHVLHLSECDIYFCISAHTTFVVGLSLKHNSFLCRWCKLLLISFQNSAHPPLNPFFSASYARALFSSVSPSSRAIRCLIRSYPPSAKTMVRSTFVFVVDLRYYCSFFLNAWGGIQEYRIRRLNG